MALTVRDAMNIARVPISVKEEMRMELRLMYVKERHHFQVGLRRRRSDSTGKKLSRPSCLQLLPNWLSSIMEE